MLPCGYTNLEVSLKSSKRDDGQQKLTMKRNIHLSFRMLRISWKARPSAICIYFSGALLEISGFVVTIYATAQLGARLAEFATGGAARDIWFWLIIDTVSAIMMGLGYFLMNYGKRMLYFAFVRWSANAYLGALCRLDMADFYDKTVRNTLNKVSAGYTWQMSNLSDANLDLIYGLMRFTAITILVSQITWWIVPLIALFLIPTLVAEGRMAKLLWFVWDAKGDERHIFWGLDYILKQAKGQMEIRSTQAADFLLGKVNNLNRDFYSEQETKYKHASRVIVPTKIIEVVGTALGSVVLIRQFLARSISLERYFFLSGALLRIGGALNNIFGTLTRMQEGLLFADSFFVLVDRQPQIIDISDASSALSEIPEIVFENVSFVYPGQEEPVFKNLSLTIESGEHVALVGENGAGKSTLIKLLLRFYRPTSGRILIDGIDLQDVAIDAWYDKLATLFQEFNHYPLPIDENITVGRSDYVDNGSRMKQSGTFGGLDGMVASYKHGWKTVLDASFKKGIEPSGGQWQRVALARAFYRDANIIILDEPTSAIDAAAEYEIFNAIFDRYASRSAIIVSHRFSTVRRADRIVVLEHGEIIEQGSHDELMRNQNTYHDLFSKQAEGYK